MVVSLSPLSHFEVWQVVVAVGVLVVIVVLLVQTSSYLIFFISHRPFSSHVPSRVMTILRPLNMWLKLPSTVTTPQKLWNLGFAPVCLFFFYAIFLPFFLLVPP